MFFNQYPYINVNDLNLDYILRAIKELKVQLDNFVNLNTIKYADPIQWNITYQYEANTVVLDALTGTAYLSKQPVPSGVALTNADYWQVIFTLDLLDINNNITLRDDGFNVVATFASDTGDWLLWNNVLYKVTQPISINTAYVVGFNLERYTVELFIKDYMTELLNIIGDLNDLTTTDKDTVVDAINEINTLIGDLTTLNTIDQSSLFNAINEVLDVADEITKIHVVTPEMFGAVGDGVNDDTTAVATALSYPNVLMVNKYLITDEIDLTNDCAIWGGGSILCSGDVAHWLHWQGAINEVSIDNINFEKLDNDFTYYNRAIFVGSASTFPIGDKVQRFTLTNCTFKNFGTAVHAYYCNEFIAHSNKILELDGTAAHSGYGLDTSSLNNEIIGLYAYNTDALTQGRHLIYVNGEAMQNTIIDDVYVRNWAKSPINLSVNTGNNFSGYDPGKAIINNIILDTVNTTPLDNDQGAIIVPSDHHGEVIISNVIAINHKHFLISSQSPNAHIDIHDIKVTCTDDSGLSNKMIIALRNVQHPTVKNVTVINRGSQYTQIVYFRQLSNGVIDSIYDVDPVGTPASAVFCASATAYAGTLVTQATTPFGVSGTGAFSPIPSYP